jgi:cytochrome c oxidase cbb3-type subunit IV
MQELYALAKQLWVVWLALLFLAIVAYAYRPSNRRRFTSYGDIPLRDGTTRNDAAPPPARR